MDALQKAQQLLEQAAEHWQNYEDSGQEYAYDRSSAEYLEERAARYAAVAQAQALTRIAEALQANADKAHKIRPGFAEFRRQVLGE